MPAILHSVGTTTRLRQKTSEGTEFIKRPSASLGARLIAEAAGLTRNEVRFYQELSSEMPIPVPRLLRACHRGWSFELVLEDLNEQGATTKSGLAALTLDEVERALSALATLHGHFWEDPRFRRELRWLTAVSIREQRLIPLARPLLERGVFRAGRSLPKALRRPLRRLSAVRNQIAKTLSAGPQTMLHYDCHPGNLYFSKTGAAGWLDWQLVRTGNWACDVGYFLATGVPERERRCEPELLGAYLAQLPRGVRPALDVAQRAVAVNKVRALEAMVLTLALGSLMPRDTLEDAISRCAGAVVESKSFERLGLR